MENCLTVLHDSFGKRSELRKDWGFAALLEFGGKRILFDTGNNARVFAHNVDALGVDLTNLDFAVISHRHGDHTSGLNHLLKVNPSLTIYTPEETYCVFGSSLPGIFYPRCHSLPAYMQYYDGKPPDAIRHGTPWPEAHFVWIKRQPKSRPMCGSYPWFLT
jgi:7,8-dihydropterin-6-yl-methyl-4-(beta-D-ribofuranosyl)aminobenzene 5'-phosphate synthase